MQSREELGDGGRAIPWTELEGGWRAGMTPQQRRPMDSGLLVSACLSPLYSADRPVGLPQTSWTCAAPCRQQDSAFIDSSRPLTVKAKHSVSFHEP